jgi:hypothetical protein
MAHATSLPSLRTHVSGAAALGPNLSEAVEYAMASRSAATRRAYPLLERVSYLDRNVRRCKYVAYMGRTKKPWPRRPLPCWLYGRLYRGRNAFLHGNPVSPKTLQPSDLKVSLFWLAPSLYRLALTGALDLSFSLKLSKRPTNEQIGKFGAARVKFNEYQMIAERALLRARK